MLGKTDIFPVSIDGDINEVLKKYRCLIFEVRYAKADRKRIWGFSSAGRAPALQAGGQRFDPANLHHIRY